MEDYRGLRSSASNGRNCPSFSTELNSSVSGRFFLFSLARFFYVRFFVASKPLNFRTAFGISATLVLPKPRTNP